MGTEEQLHSDANQLCGERTSEKETGRKRGREGGRERGREGGREREGGIKGVCVGVLLSYFVYFSCFD